MKPGTFRIQKRDNGYSVEFATEEKISSWHIETEDALRKLLTDLSEKFGPLVEDKDL